MISDPVKDLPHLLKVRELASLLRVENERGEPDTRRLLDLHRRGRIPPGFRIGGQAHGPLRWYRDEVLSWLRESHAPRSARGGSR